MFKKKILVKNEVTVSQIASRMSGSAIKDIPSLVKQINRSLLFSQFKDYSLRLTIMVNKGIPIFKLSLPNSSILIREKVVNNSIYINDLKEIAKIKMLDFNTTNLDSILNSLYGTCKSMNVIVKNDSEN